MTAKLDAHYKRALELASDVDGSFLDLGRSLRNLLDHDPRRYKQVVQVSGIGPRKA